MVIAMSLLGFNPTRVRLKPIRNITQTHDRRLQPHEGPSETSDKEGRTLSRQLQPHEGPSETGPTCQRESEPCQLQPHEGPSETLLSSPGALGV